MKKVYQNSQRIKILERVEFFRWEFYLTFPGLTLCILWYVMGVELTTKQVQYDQYMILLLLETITIIIIIRLPSLSTPP